MSLNQIISDVHEKFNGRRSSVLDHTSMGTPFYTNGGCRQSDIKEAIQRYLQFVPEQIGATGKSNLHNFGKLAVEQNPKKKTSTNSGCSVCYRPAPKLKRACKLTKPGRIDSFETRVYSELSFTKKNVTEITRDFGHALTAALVKQGNLTLGALGTFYVSGNQDSENDQATPGITFTPSQYLGTKLAKLSGKKIAGFDRKRARKKTKRKQRTKRSSVTGNLDRKQMAKIRKLLRSRDVGNVQMAMMLLDQLASQDDYRAVHATAGLIERLLRTPHPDVKAACGKIVMKTGCQEAKKGFWKLIGLKREKFSIRKYKRDLWSQKNGDWDSTDSPGIRFSHSVLEADLFHDFLASEPDLAAISLYDIDRLTEISLLGQASLRKFCLSSNQSVTLTLKDLAKLIEIDLKVGSKTVVELEQVPMLQAIDIGLVEDQGEFNFEPFLAATALRHIEIKGDGLKALPNRFGNLQALESLYVSSTGITSLPESFGNLVNLRELHIGNGVTLPGSFGNLINLRELHIGNDVTLPESFGNLVNLRELHIGNDVTLPESFGNLKSLQKLVVTGNDDEDGQLDPRVGRLPALSELQVPTRTRLPIELGNIESLKTVTMGQGYHSTNQASTIILDLCRQAMAKRK